MNFFKNKRVFVTGHTGFKGSWLTRILLNSGATVFGYSLESPTDPSLYKLCDFDGKLTSTIGDIRDFDSLYKAFSQAQPEIVLHLAAQPIVRDSYKLPKYTYETNVMGTVNILECVRLSGCVKSFLNVTTDKVYENNEQGVPFSENMPLDGFDPYSNSKSCSELVTHSYKNSFFGDGSVAISTARAGNVIGGGDFAVDRIIPDAVRAFLTDGTLIIRNPNSTRPYQHVLEPLFAYLMIAKAQYEDVSKSGYYNVGPNESDCLTTGELIKLFGEYCNGFKSEVKGDNGPHEANFLKLDCKKLKETFGWEPLLNAEKAVKMVVEWSKAYKSGDNVLAVMDKQICDYEKLFNEKVLSL